MKVLVTKANDDYWHKVVDVKTIEDVMKLYHRVIIEKTIIPQQMKSLHIGKELMIERKLMKWLTVNMK